MRAGLVVFLLALFVQASWAQEKVRIGFIDMERALNESQAGKKAKEKFQAEVEKVRGDLLKEKKEVDRLIGDFQKKAVLLKEDEKTNLENEIQRKNMGLQRRQRDAEEELGQMRNKMTADILKDLQGVVGEIWKSDKFTLILERSQVLYSDQGIDITNKVIDLYNSRTSGKVTKGK